MCRIRILQLLDSLHPPNFILACLFSGSWHSAILIHMRELLYVCVCSDSITNYINTFLCYVCFSKKILKWGGWCCSLSGVVGSKLSSIAMLLAQFKLSLGDCVTPKTWKLGSLQWFISNCFCPSCTAPMSEQESPLCGLIPGERAACADGWVFFVYGSAQCIFTACRANFRLLNSGINWWYECLYWI